MFVVHFKLSGRRFPLPCAVIIIVELRIVMMCLLRQCFPLAFEIWHGRFVRHVPLPCHRSRVTPGLGVHVVWSDIPEDIAT
jgi:hypothetical protein